VEKEAVVPWPTTRIPLKRQRLAELAIGHLWKNALNARN
jgi:hypothetical protein